MTLDEAIAAWPAPPPCVLPKECATCSERRERRLAAMRALVAEGARRALGVVGGEPLCSEEDAASIAREVLP